MDEPNMSALETYLETILNDNSFKMKDLVELTQFMMSMGIPPAIQSFVGRGMYSDVADATRRLEKSQYVYACVFDGYIKLGYSKNPKDRIRQINSTNALRSNEVYFVNVDNMRDIEKVLHGKFKDYQKNGEYFDITTEQAVEALHLYGKVEHYTLPGEV